MNQNWL